jgi:adenosine deaminase
VCPNSNVVIANAVPRLELHPFRRMREAGLLATLNTDDPALTDLDLGREYRSCMKAFGYQWADMVEIALDGVEATWLDESDKRDVRERVEREAAELGAALDQD